MSWGSWARSERCLRWRRAELCDWHGADRSAPQAHGVPGSAPCQRPEPGTSVTLCLVVQKSPTGTSTQSATLIGLLADEQRLRVVAAIALGARTIEAAAAAADTDLATVQSVLPRLVSAGLIEQRDRV
jgi:hypothetical protein